jgi:hypothetical protein
MFRVTIQFALVTIQFALVTIQFALVTSVLAFSNTTLTRKFKTHQIMQHLIIGAMIISTIGVQSNLVINSPDARLRHQEVLTLSRVRPLPKRHNPISYQSCL